MVSNLALEIPHLIRQMGSFEEPMSKQWAMPISTPYSPGLKCSEYSPHHFISRVMTRICCGFADAVVAGGHCPQEVAAAFKDELEEKVGIHSTYQAVWVRKRAIHVL